MRNRKAPNAVETPPWRLTPAEVEYLEQLLVNEKNPKRSMHQGAMAAGHRHHLYTQHVSSQYSNRSIHESYMWHHLWYFDRSVTSEVHVTAKKWFYTYQGARSTLSELLYSHHCHAPLPSRACRRCRRPLSPASPFAAAGFASPAASLQRPTLHSFILCLDPPKPTARHSSRHCAAAQWRPSSRPRPPHHTQCFVRGQTHGMYSHSTGYVLENEHTKRKQSIWVGSPGKFGTQTSLLSADLEISWWPPPVWHLSQKGVDESVQRIPFILRFPIDIKWASAPSDMGKKAVLCPPSGSHPPGLPADCQTQPHYRKGL